MNSTSSANSSGASDKVLAKIHAILKTGLRPASYAAKSVSSLAIEGTTWLHFPLVPGYEAELHLQKSGAADRLVERVADVGAHLQW